MKALKIIGGVALLFGVACLLRGCYRDMKFKSHDRLDPGEIKRAGDQK